MPRAIDRTATSPRAGMKAFARGTFRGYKSQSGEIQLKMPDIPMEVELFKERADTWKARAVEGGGVFKDISGNVERVMLLVQERFEAMDGPWRWVDEHGDPAEAATEPKGLHHLIGPKEAQQQFPRIKRTLCGRVVMSHRITERLGEVNCGPCRLALDNMPAE